MCCLRFSALCHCSGLPNILIPSLLGLPSIFKCHATHFAISGPGCVSQKRTFTKTEVRTIKYLIRQMFLEGGRRRPAWPVQGISSSWTGILWASIFFKKKLSITYLSSWGASRGQTQRCQRLKLVGKSRQSWAIVSASSSSSSSPALPLRAESQVRVKLGSHGQIQKQGAAASPRCSGGWLNLWQRLEPHVCFSCRCPARGSILDARAEAGGVDPAGVSCTIYTSIREGGDTRSKKHPHQDTPSFLLSLSFFLS